jgi:hypothetical protein
VDAIGEKLGKQFLGGIAIKTDEGTDEQPNAHRCAARTVM